MSRTLVSVTPFSTNSAIAAFSMRSRVSVNRCRGIVSKRLFTITESSAIVKSLFPTLHRSQRNAAMRGSAANAPE